MVRYEDPPGSFKHIRFGTNSPELVHSLQNFPGVKIGVEHAKGRKGSETPHIHVWYEVPDGKEVTNVTVKNWLKAYSPMFTKYSGQQAWSFRNHDSRQTFAEYVMRNQTAKVVVNNTEINLEALRPPPPTEINPDLGGHEHVILIQKQRKESMRDKIVAHLEQKGWRYGEQNPTKVQVFKEVFHFWENAFTIPEGERMVRYVLYKFSDDATREGMLEYQYQQMCERF